MPINWMRIFLKYELIIKSNKLVCDFLYFIIFGNYTQDPEAKIISVFFFCLIPNTQKEKKRKEKKNWFTHNFINTYVITEITTFIHHYLYSRLQKWVSIEYGTMAYHSDITNSSFDSYESKYDWYILSLRVFFHPSILVLLLHSSSIYYQRHTQLLLQYIKDPYRFVTFLFLSFLKKEEEEEKNAISLLFSTCSQSTFWDRQQFLFSFFIQNGM